MGRKKNNKEEIEEVVEAIEVETVAEVVEEPAIEEEVIVEAEPVIEEEHKAIAKKPEVTSTKTTTLADFLF